MSRTSQPAFGFAGWSGSGKTTLIEKLIAHLSAKGLIVSLIKHAHHEFDLDHPGKDSFRHREAGASQILVSSARRWALMTELAPTSEELSYQQALAQLAPCDLVLIEGYKHAPIPKIEIYRSAISKPLLHPKDPHIVAIAADMSDISAGQFALPTYDLADHRGIAQFILNFVGLSQR